MKERLEAHRESRGMFIADAALHHHLVFCVLCFVIFHASALSWRKFPRRREALVAATGQAGESTDERCGETVSRWRISAEQFDRPLHLAKLAEVGLSPRRKPTGRTLIRD